MKHLKLTQPIFQNYCGIIGRYHFVDGVSVEMLPEVERVRISANFACVEVEEDGEDGVNPSPAVSVVSGQHLRAELSNLPRQDEDDKTDENVRAVMGADGRKILYSRLALEELASQSGISGLREIATEWGVKSKSIPVLMQMILDAQEGYRTDQRAALGAKGVPADEIEKMLDLMDKVALVKAEEKVLTTAQPAVQDVVQAAITGDLAAALNVSLVEAERPE